MEYNWIIWEYKVILDKEIGEKLILSLQMELACVILCI